MSACHWCASEEGTPIEGMEERVELRPYGPDGALVCFDCGMSEAHIEETNRNIVRHLQTIVSSGHVPVVTDSGIVPG